MRLNCIIVDDEPIAQNILKGYVNDTPDLNLIGVYNNAMEAIVILNREQVDLMFLDIEMPKISGISFIKTLKNKPLVIFCTAYREFAIESYDLNAVDYLLKPFSFERFLKAINKAKDLIPQSSTSSEDYCYFKVDRKNVKIYYKEILYVEGLSNYVVIHTQKEQFIVYTRLKDLEKSLPQNTFVRIHRSFIISSFHMKAYGPDYVEIGDKQLTIGNTYKGVFFNFIENNS